jgi:nitroreductase
MNTLEAIAKRTSVRSYKPEQISEEELQAIIKAGCAAPVASAQYETLHITVVQDAALRKKVYNHQAEYVFAKLGIRQETDFGAPTLILVSSAPVKRPGMQFTNSGCVIENMVIAATDLGIASVVLAGAPFALQENAELQKELGIPEGFVPVLGAAFGYGAEDVPPAEHTITVNRV